MKRLLIFFLFLAPVFALNAQSVDLLWQGETYRPPFYEGRSLWSYQSIIKFVAIPQGLGDPTTLNYKWTKNGTVLGMVSGVGRNFLSFEDDVFSKPQEVKVEIISTDKKVLAEAKTTVRPQSAVLLVYENNPLYGYLFNREIGAGYRLREGEVTFSAFPLFATPATRDGANLSYSWTTSDGEIQSGSSVTYRAPEDAEGTSEVMLNISNSHKILVDLNRNFLVQFGNE